MSIMCLDHTSILPGSLRRARLAHQRGFTLISAIFLLVILSALGVFMLSMSTMQQTTSYQDVQGSRVYQAAKSGIEWGAYQIMTPENNNPPVGGVAQYVCPGGSTTLPVMGGTLNAFVVVVSCSSNTFNEGPNVLTVYRLTSTASTGAAPSSNFIERSVTATINTCRVTPNGVPC